MIRSLTLTALTMTLAACATPKLDVTAHRLVAESSMAQAMQGL